MRTRFPLLSVFILGSLALGDGCSPAPTQDALGWNGRGMPLPADNGAAGQGSAGQGAAGTSSGGGGNAGRGSGGIAGDGTSGAAGTGAESGGRGGTTSGGGAGGATNAGGSGGAVAGTSGTGTAGTGGSGGSSLPPPVDAGGPLVSATCHLDVVVTTHSGGGNHQPKNVDAIWIQDAGGKFVKSLYVMARNEIQHLNFWNTQTAAAGLSRNRVDAVTGATLPSYGTRVASWSCTDVNQKPVATGAYQVCFDLNDGNGTDKHTCDNIVLGGTAATVTPPDALPCFTARTLTYKP